MSSKKKGKPAGSTNWPTGYEAERYAKPSVPVNVKRANKPSSPWVPGGGIDYGDDDDNAQDDMTSGGTIYVEKCLHRMTPIEGADGLFGSSVRGGVEVPGNSVTVILAHDALEIAIPAGWATWHSRTFNSHLSGALVYWPWVDMAAPVFDEQMVARIIELYLLHKSGKKIEVACHGGHGRTGTLLAILAALAQGWAPGKAVSILRERYCEKAVETPKQEAFVEQAIVAVRKELTSRGVDVR